MVIRINSFSKMLAPGLRLGWISAVRPIVEQLALIKQVVDPHTQNLAQLVVVRADRERHVRRASRRAQDEHRRRRDAIVHALQQHVPAPRLRFALPDGGMYLWCQLPPGVGARAVQQTALRESVMVLTGEPFYVDQRGDRQLRICYTAQPTSRAAACAKVLARSIAAVSDAAPAPAHVRVV